MKNKKLSGIGVSKCGEERAEARPQTRKGEEAHGKARPYKCNDGEGQGETCVYGGKAAGMPALRNSAPEEKRQQAAALQRTGFAGREDRDAKRRQTRRYNGAGEEGQGQAHPGKVTRGEPRPIDVSEGKPDGTEIWKQYEDLLIPRLRLTVIERAVYSHLLRHSRLEGKQRLRFSILWAAQSSGLSTTSVRKGVRQLAAKGALRLTERSKRGHVIEMRLPEEIREVRASGSAEERRAQTPETAKLEAADFLETPARREAIYARDGGRCFYCLRRVTAARRCIDHVIPQARQGNNSYRNLVASCAECNAQKCEQRAEDFLRWLYREGSLGAGELKERLGALQKLAAGALQPAMAEGRQQAQVRGEWREGRAYARLRRASPA
jgi:5-methylcytosine-specific restriction endonuclease McrA